MLRPNACQGFHILELSRSHKTTRHSTYDSPGRVISSSQRPLSYNIQHSQETGIHVPGGIRTCNPSRWEGVDPCLRPRSHWDISPSHTPWRCGPTRAMASSFLRFLDHTQRRITVGSTPLDAWSVPRRDLYLTTHSTHNKHPYPRWDSNPRSQQESDRRPTP